MTITGGSALPKEDIERMAREAEEHAAEDKKRREEAEVRNQAESLVYSTEKVLADNGDKVPEDVKTEVTAAVGELKTALEGDDVEAVKSKQAALNAVSQKIGEAIYKSEQAGASADAASDGAPADTSSPASDEDVVDAEIVDEDEAAK